MFYYAKTTMTLSLNPLITNYFIFHGYKFFFKINFLKFAKRIEYSRRHELRIWGIFRNLDFDLNFENLQIKTLCVPVEYNEIKFYKTNIQEGIRSNELFWSIIDVLNASRSKIINKCINNCRFLKFSSNDAYRCEISPFLREG